MMDYNTLIKALKAKEYKPIYFLQGEEAYFIDEIAKEIEQNALEEHEKDFNQTIFYGKDTTTDAIMDAAKRYPMMAERQVIIIREAQHLKKHLDDFKEFLEKPLDSTILVFCYKYGKLDGRTEMAKLFAKTCLFTSSALKEYEVPNWVANHVQLKGFKIDQKTTVLISDYLGNNLQKIAGEVEKLALVVKPGERITPVIIQKHIGLSKDYNPFELQDALLKQDVLKANKIINYFAKNPKENPDVFVIAILFGLFQKLMKIHFAKNKNNDSALAKEIKTHPFFIKQYKLALNFYSPKRLAYIISLLRNADLQAKGIGKETNPPGELLKQLVFQILH